MVKTQDVFGTLGCILGGKTPKMAMQSRMNPIEVDEAKNIDSKLDNRQAKMDLHFGIKGQDSYFLSMQCTIIIIP